MYQSGRCPLLPLRSRKKIFPDFGTFVVPSDLYEGRFRDRTGRVVITQVAIAPLSLAGNPSRRRDTRPLPRRGSWPFPDLRLRDYSGKKDPRAEEVRVPSCRLLYGIDGPLTPSTPWPPRHTALFSSLPTTWPPLTCGRDQDDGSSTVSRRGKTCLRVRIPTKDRRSRSQRSTSLPWF